MMTSQELSRITDKEQMQGIFKQCHKGDISRNHDSPDHHPQQSQKHGCHLHHGHHYHFHRAFHIHSSAWSSSPRFSNTRDSGHRRPLQRGLNAKTFDLSGFLRQTVDHPRDHARRPEFQALALTRDFGLHVKQLFRVYGFQPMLHCG